MRVLVACEFSGVVREVFRARGCEVWSCDLLPSEDNSPFHIQGDIRHVLTHPWNKGKIDLLIAHPPCTYLSVSGLHWNKKNPQRAQKTEEALDFVRFFMELPIEKICIENPVSCISTRIRKPDQIIQPYEFGHDASKRTCLWLKGLPLLPIYPEERLSGRMIDGRERWSNQTDTGQNKLGPSEDRWKLRSVTYKGIAERMAQTWG